MSEEPSKRETVLFVDDESSVLDGLCNALRNEPYDIITANSAAQAIDIIAKQQIDVVVSDERMPGMSGSELLSLIHSRQPRTIRIMLTGQASFEVAVHAINDSEIYRLLTKPCNPVDLARTIQDALLIRKLTQQNARLLAAARSQRSMLEELEKDK